MASRHLNNNAMILNGVYWLFATKSVFLGILVFKTFITRDTFITPSLTLFESEGVFELARAYVSEEHQNDRECRL